ncbi:MAG: hypothetical protein AB8G26_19455 [Ilumatobacter sp.]
MRPITSTRRTAVLASTSMLVTAATLAMGTAAGAANDPVPFACDPGFYQVIAGQFAEFDPGAGTYNRIGQDLDNYNAIGYRQADGLIYGVGSGNVYRIDATGDRTVIGSLGRSGGYTGAFGDDGLLHVSRGGRDWVKIDVDTMEITPVPGLSSALGVADITNVNGIFYGVSTQGDLVRIDPVTESIDVVGAVAGLPRYSGAYGAAWSTAGGNLYVGRNSGEIFQVTGYSTDRPVATQVGSAPSTNSNDGASCELAPPPPGLADVDGPEPETEPSTPAAIAAAEAYEENFTETPIVLPDPTPIAPVTPAPAPDNDDVFIVEDAGIGGGGACAATVIEDRPARDPDGRFVTVNTPTVLHQSNGNAVDWTFISGTWSAGGSGLAQTEDCDYDATALLTPFSVIDFRWEATVSGPATARGGLLIGQSSDRTRSGATLIDLADDGRTIRWGSYNERGHYVYVGGETLDSPADGSTTIAVVVKGAQVIVEVDGTFVGAFITRFAGGKVGVVATRSQATFTDMTLTALPGEGGAQ